MIRITLLAYLICSNLLLAYHPLNAQETTALKPAPTLPGINAALQEYVDDHTIAGAVTLIGHDGKIVHLEAIGLANVETNKAMKPFMLFSIASMTKPIVATAVMMLQDEGKLDVNDNVSKYLPAYANLKFKNGEPVDDQITIRDCLTHTSGLAGSQVFSGSLAAAVDELAERPLAFPPRTKWQYSPGLNVVGRIVEVVSKQPLDAFLHQRIFEPLGMNNTKFVLDEKQKSRVATIYAPGEDGTSIVAAENHISDLSSKNGPNPSGGLVSSARDLFRFYQMVLNEGRFRKQRILSKEAVSEMTSPQTGDLETGFTPGNCWGLGWCIVREPQGVTGMLSPGTYGHGGAFGTQGWVDPKTNTIYVLLIQRTKFGNSDASKIRQTFQEQANKALDL